MTPAPRTLQEGFLASVARCPDRPALAHGTTTWTYRALHAHAASIAATLAALVPQPAQPLTGVLAHRSLTAYAGVLGTLLRGHGYVPLNPDFPPDRLAVMLNRSEIEALVVDAHGLPKLLPVLALADRPITVVCPDAEGAPLPALPAPHRLIGPEAMRGPEGFTPPEVGPDAIGNLLFTSGSTGTPKAVMVAQRNLAAFMRFVIARYELGPDDRFSQLFELGFDLHGFDLFGAWWVGACVCCPTPEQMLMPAEYIEAARLTVFFAVPSRGVVLKQLGFLEPGAFPHLRVSLFCGEALPADMTRAWALAAPGSIVENLYGPTELTLACRLYRWDADRSPGECENGLVPIGEAFPDMDTFVAGEGLREVAPGEIGELLMAGPQVTLGYWRDAEKTAAAFVVPPGRDTLHYRTGDLVRRPMGDRPMTFLGRADSQIKVRGHRIELGDVEAALCAAAGTDFAVALGHPKSDAGYDAIVGFVAGVEMTPKALRAAVATRLPAYMVPAKCHVLPAFPLNDNGKVDRKALGAMLAAGELPR